MYFKIFTILLQKRTNVSFKTDANIKQFLNSQNVFFYFFAIRK